MEKVLIIYNDSSGKNTGQSLAEQLMAYIEKMRPSWKVKSSITNASTSSETLIKQAEEFEATRLVFIGGDGTIHHLVKAFKDTLANYKVGIIPGGTVNNFARSLDIPGSPEEAFIPIINEDYRKVDFGVINNEDVIISTLTIGILADTAARVSQEEKQKFGPFAFAKRFIKLWYRKKRYHLVVSANDKQWKGKMALLTVTMTNSAGGYVYFDPNATPDDGKMHVTILEKLSVWQTFKLLPKIILGNLETIKDVLYFSSESITIESTDKNVQTRTDGDPTTSLPIQLEVRPQAMTVLVPKKQ